MSQQSSVTVLLVDDDRVDQKLLSRAFARAQVQNPLLVANDGVEALDILRGRASDMSLCKPYLILLDLNMPRMTGHEFLEAVRADPALVDSTVFVLTTSNDRKDVQRAYQQNAAGYITKDRAGADYGELLSMLDSYLDVVALPT